MAVVNEEPVVPEFAHAVRGYDRYQVDDYIERLNEWAAETETRAAEAERTAHAQADQIRSLRERVDELEDQHPPTSDHALRAAAGRATAAVTAALEEADQMRRRAEAEADRRLQEADRQALATLEAVRQAVAGLSEEAGKERKEARRRIDSEVEEAHNQAEDLRRRAADVAESTVTEARAEADRILADTEATVERLRVERAQILEELGRLRGAIQTLITPLDQGGDGVEGDAQKA